MNRLLGLATVILLLSGCISYPDKVRVEEGTNLVPFQTAFQQDFKKTGDKARWSGVIADVKNLKSQTQIDVLFYQSSGNGRPKVSGEPIGRFRVISDDFLDPAVYKKGKSITALGDIAIKQTDKIGEYEYEYPTLSKASVYLWPKVKPLPNTQVHYGWYGPHPSYYWRGGVRYVYVRGAVTSGSNVKAVKSKKNKN